MNKSSLKKILMCVLTLCAMVVPACLFAGCKEEKTINATFASTKKVESATVTEARETGYYIEIDVDSEEERITIKASDFKYIQNGQTKTAKYFLGRLVVSQVTINGESVDQSYYEYTKTRDVVKSPGYEGLVVTLKLVVENDSPISKIFYKDKEITLEKIN